MARRAKGRRYYPAIGMDRTSPVFFRSIDCGQKQIASVGIVADQAVDSLGD